MNKELLIQVQEEITNREMQAIAAMTTGEIIIALEEMALEGFIDFGKVKGLFQSLMSRFTASSGNKEPIQYLLSQRDISTAIAKLMKIKVHNLSNFSVYIPEGLTSPMVSYLQFLNSSIAELSSVDNRLLRPLEMWAGQLISDPSYATKVWVNTFGAAANTTKMADDLKHFFTTDSKKVHTNMAIFTNVYIGQSDVLDSNHLLGKLVEMSDNLLSGLLSERVKAVSKLIGQAMDLESFSKIPSERIKPIITLTGQAATEIEMLSMLIFQVKSAATAYSNTVDKINSQLK